MQYMPISFDTVEYSSPLGNYGLYSDLNSSFSNELNNAVNEQNQIEEEENEEDDDKDDTSVYSGRAEIYSFFVPQDPRFNREELEKLARAFQKDNVSIEAQNALADIMNKPGGPTAKELLAALTKSTKGGNAELNTEEIAYLQNLAGRANPAQPTVLYDSLRYQGGKAGMDALVSALKQNPTTFSQEELAAVAKALNIPAGVQKGMQDILAGFDKNKVLSKDQVDSLFKEAQTLLQTKQDEFEKMQKSLAENLKPILETAQKREAEERRALMRENKEVLQSKILIEDTMLTKVMGEDLNRRVSKEGREQLLAAAKVKDERDTTAKAEDRFFEGKAADKESAKEEFERFNPVEKAQEKTNDGKQETAGKEKSFQPKMSYEERVLAGMAGLQNMQIKHNQPVNTANFADLSQSLRGQVQDSILTLMKNGAKHLEVSLNPVELGEMAVALTLKNGEVDAVIKTEKQESASMINQQIEAIRQQLENQGFKVKNIEVEVGLSNFADNGSGQNWESMQQHNNEQAFKENLQNLNYLRALSRQHNSSADTLAHNMQNIGSIVAGRENNSLQGLHIIT